MRADSTHYLSALALLALFLLGCQQPSNETTPSDGSTEVALDSAAFGIDVAGGSIYVAGEVWDGSQWQSCYWKDGQRTETGGRVARSIYLDPYYGTVNTGGQSGGYPYFWSDTNGFPLDIGVYPESFVGIVRSIAPFAGTYLAAGTDHTTTGLPNWYPYEAVLWAGSNRRIALNAGNPGDAYSVYVSNNTSYVAGRLFDGNVWVPFYWTAPPEAATTLPGGVGSAYSIFADSGTIYTSGQLFNGRNWVACYWTGTAVTPLMSDGIYSSSANGIAVSGGIVYAVGDYFDGTNWIPCFWTGGVRTDLAGASEDAYVSSLIIVGGKLYAVGYYYDGTKYVACYWADGTKTDLTGITVNSSAKRGVGSRASTAPFHEPFRQGSAP